MSEPEGQRLCRGQGQRQNGVGGAVRISMCITTYMLVLPKAPPARFRPRERYHALGHLLLW